MIKGNVSNIIKSIKVRYYAILAVATTTILMASPTIAEAASIPGALNAAANDANSTVTQSLKAILTFVLIGCALFLFFGGERGKDSVKGKIGTVLIAVALILWAPEVVGTILGWFGK